MTQTVKKTNDDKKKNIRKEDMGNVYTKNKALPCQNYMTINNAGKRTKR